MVKQHRNVLVLSGCQAALQVNGVTLTVVTGLAGYALASNKALATVPLTCYVIGSAITTVPASFLMHAIGRRGGFQVGTTTGAVGALMCALSLYMSSFLMLCAGMLVLGVYTAFGKYYRFAAADVADIDWKAKAISLTLAGGIAGGILGPEMAKRTTNIFDGQPYIGPYLSLVVMCILTTLLLTRLHIPKLSDTERKDSGRPLKAIMAQPTFICAVLASMLSYGIMNLFMTSTPLAMRAHEHHFNDAAFVLQWHVIGMYGPSFFTGSLIHRLGVLNVMLLGTLLLLVCVVVALAGTAVFNFWLSLFLLGIGWNFMYVGGSALLTESHTPAERAKTQAANDFLVFLTMAISSTSSGLLLNKAGWHAVNYGSIPFLVLAASSTLWLMWQRRPLRKPA